MSLPRYCQGRRYKIDVTRRKVFLRLTLIYSFVILCQALIPASDMLSARYAKAGQASPDFVATSHVLGRVPETNLKTRQRSLPIRT
jgi:hypothetical protein